MADDTPTPPDGDLPSLAGLSLNDAPREAAAPSGPSIELPMQTLHLTQDKKGITLKKDQIYLVEAHSPTQGLIQAVFRCRKPFIPDKTDWEEQPGNEVEILDYYSFRNTKANPGTYEQKFAKAPITYFYYRFFWSKPGVVRFGQKPFDLFEL